MTIVQLQAANYRLIKDHLKDKFLFTFSLPRR